MMTSEYWLFSTGYLALLDLLVLLVVIPYVVLRWREWVTPHHSVAVASAIYLTGHMINRAWAWLWLFLNARGGNAWMVHWPVVPIGTAVTSVGLVCYVRVLLGRPTWGPTAWLWFVVASAVVAAVPLIVLLWP